MIPCYVIYLGDSFPNKQSLINIGLDPIGFKGVDARKNEHLQYQNKIHDICKYTCPKSTIGCGLSHILLAQKLYDENIDMALILEDDAYPKVSQLDVRKIIQEVPDDWELIKLHCDMYCKDGSYQVGHNGSNAAFIINNKGIKKLKNLKVLNHIDVQMNYFSGIVMYKSKVNLFSADESTSTIRGDYTNDHWASNLMQNPTSGEKIKAHVFMYKLLRIPGTNIEITFGSIINIILIILILSFILSNYVSF
jgi:hypothetical protein